MAAVVVSAIVEHQDRREHKRRWARALGIQPVARAVVQRRRALGTAMEALS